MKKAAWILILSLVIFALAGCSLFFSDKMVSYSVSNVGASVDIVAADEDGTVFDKPLQQTDWDYGFELKYSDFPFLALLVVTNNSASVVNMAIKREDTVVVSQTVAIGETEVLTESVSYD